MVTGCWVESPARGSQPRCSPVSRAAASESPAPVPPRLGHRPPARFSCSPLCLLRSALWTPTEAGISVARSLAHSLLPFRCRPGPCGLGPDPSVGPQCAQRALVRRQPPWEGGVWLSVVVVVCFQMRTQTLKNEVISQAHTVRGRAGFRPGLHYSRMGLLVRSPLTLRPGKSLLQRLSCGCRLSAAAWASTSFVSVASPPTPFAMTKNVSRRFHTYTRDRKISPVENRYSWGFRSRPAVRTQCFHCRGHGFSPWL